MNFYEKLSTVYDKVFIRNPKTIEFLEDSITKVNGHNFLDAACGTGTYGIALLEKGYSGTGVDLDEAMIKLSKEKSKGLNSLTFKTMDMRNIKDEFKEESYSLIYCIGNSLVHLNSLKEINKVIEGFYKVIEPKGALIIQIINYDRILNKNIKALPTIENQGVTFIRNYNFNKDENKVYFNTELKILGEDLVYTGSTPLFPLLYNDIINILKENNFSKIESFGDFAYSPYNEESYSLVIRAYK
ncbi:class I SAM-dependent methyltransferase [Clostridium hydrogeniformans]|uniref:class I SAM-dependent methyltransferase n=1 Tax=Clostridium hydrogeniformans TaxID=349933 RepID=UPI0004849B40|nr:class I SAM-dependent methyltransferase [Clostridium hydrogeniformans]